MREIKFRAYHTKQKRMFDVYCLGIDLVTESTYNGVDYGNNVFCGDDVNFIKIMQYTGLKDKNGKEIYEGDILNFHVFTQELGANYGVIEGEKEYVGVIEFGGLGLILDYRKHKDDEESWFYLVYSPGMMHEESMEIIGNIYENPELLTP